jgi:23S rRNA U2552 (ribose-2'-O)-methylase RlmE/FtsJ
MGADLPYEPTPAYLALQEMDKEHPFFEPFQPECMVLDLGCSPGGWSRYALEQIGERGRIVGYDVRPCSVAHPKFDFINRDVFYRTGERGMPVFHVVLSDLVDVEHPEHQLDLAKAAYGLARDFLQPGGLFVVRVNVRKKPKKERKTLVALVKDMAAVFSSIEAYAPQQQQELCNKDGAFVMPDVYLIAKGFVRKNGSRE